MIVCEASGGLTLSNKSVVLDRTTMAEYPVGFFLEGDAYPRTVLEGIGMTEVPEGVTIIVFAGLDRVVL